MDIYQTITDRIITEMEKGVIPWRKPWVSNPAVSYATGKPYSLLNQMLLGGDGEYLTFNECRKLGGCIRRGEKAHMVVFWKWLEEKDEETDEIKKIPFLRYYNVFHISQCEGVAARHTVPMVMAASADDTAEAMMAAYIDRSGVRLNHCESDNAYYCPATDSITLPLLAQFADTAEYYSTAFHEMYDSQVNVKGVAKNYFRAQKAQARV